MGRDSAGNAAILAGNACMNVTMIDVTEVEGAQVGDEVVIIGKQGNVQQTAADLASTVGRRYHGS